MIKFTLLGLLAIAIAGLPVGASAKNTNAPAAKQAKATKPSSLPFHGKLKAVDQTAKTISVGEQTIQITSETIITKTGKPATLGEGVVGENVSGAYKKSDDGKLTATKVSFGTKAEKPAKPAKEKAK